jgi:hypothetical protein
MAIPAPASMGDVAYELNSKAVTDAGVQLILSNAQSLTGHMDRLRFIGEAAVGRMQQTLVQEDPMEAAAAKQILTGHAGLDTTLITSLAQIMSKVAQSTPPPTP